MLGQTMFYFVRNSMINLGENVTVVQACFCSSYFSKYNIFGIVAVNIIECVYVSPISQHSRRDKPFCLTLTSVITWMFKDT